MKRPDSDSIRPWLTAGRKALIVAAGLFLMVFVLWQLFPGLIAVLQSGDVAEIEAYLQSTNRSACLVFLVVMQILQVASIVIPALPIHIAAGAVFDLLPGFLVCWGAFVGANLTIFLIIRHLGGSLRVRAQRFVQESKAAAPLRKLMDTGNAGLFVVIANIVPFLPNGIIPYAAAMTDLSAAQFVCSVAIGSALPTLADCALGDLILGGDFLPTVFIFGALFLLAFLLYRRRRQIAALLSRFSKKA